MNRFARRLPWFASDRDCSLFVDALADVPERFDARIHGYAVMPNHYHLMLEVPRGNLSQVMRYVGATFTQAYHRRHGTDGPLFRGRFKNQWIDTEAYWMHLLAYVHLNPVKAHLAPDPASANWTSHLAYAEPRLRPAWLTTQELLSLFGSRSELLAYIEAVRVKRSVAPAEFDPASFWSGPTSRPPPEPVRPRRSPEEAIREVALVLGVDDPRLGEASGPTPCTGRRLVAWWLRESTDLTLTDAARILGVTRARASQLIGALRRQARTDAQARDWMHALHALRG
jgi:REP element-mobilizing transposase RayT